MSTPEDGGTVRYNVKDLLGAIDKKLDKVIESLGQKAERTDVYELRGRVDALEKQAEVSRLLANSREEHKDKSLTRGQAIVTSFAAIASTAALFLSGLHWINVG